jgi:MFS family permease
VSKTEFKSKENRSKSSRTSSAYSRGKYFPKRLEVLAARDFRLFYAGYTTSLLGTAMSAVAIAFALLGVGGTATGLGLVFTANIVPMIVFLLVGGALADRLGRRRVMLAADLVRCSAQAVLAAALAVGRPGLWLFVAAAFVVGAGNAFFSPALSGLPVQLVPPGQLGDANALLGTADPAAKVAGPALAGLLIAVTSPALVIAADAGTYALSALALAGLRFPESANHPARRRQLPGRLDSDRVPATESAERPACRRQFPGRLDSDRVPATESAERPACRRQFPGRLDSDRVPATESAERPARWRRSTLRGLGRRRLRESAATRPGPDPVSGEPGGCGIRAAATSRPRGSSTPCDPGRPRFKEATEPQHPRRNSLLRDLAEGWAEFTARPWLWPQTVQFALFNLVTWGPYLVLGPVLARQYLGGARAWGAILACSGCGAILGGLLALGRHPRRPLLTATLATLGFALPPLALALHLPLPAVAGAALGQGLCTAFGGAFATTVEQRLIPAEALSRVGAFNMVGAFALGPVAFIAAGPAAVLFGPRAVLAFGAAWSATMTLAVLASPAIRHQPWPEDQRAPVRLTMGA